MTTRRYDFVSTIETSTAPSFTDPTDPNDPINLAFGDDRYVQGRKGVQDIAALKALDVADRQNRDLILVVAKNAVYRYDSASSATADDDRIVEPTAGSGRYFLVSPIDPATGNLTVPGALTVTGDLTVNGTTTSVSTTNVEIEDANIVLNKGGDEASADSAVSGFSVEMSDATDARLGFDSNLASKFKAGEVGSESEIITASAAQTLTGVKTFDAHTLHDELAVEPASPPAGYRTLFADSTGFKQKDSAGVVSGLGGDGGSGSGEINMIGSPSLAADWVASGAGITVATTTTSAELPLEGSISTAIKITNVSGTDYVRYRFTMAQSLKQALLKIEFFQRALTGFANDDMKMEMWTNAASDYSGAYTEVPLATDVSGDSFIKNESGVYRTSFFAAAEDYYELRIVRVAGTAALSIANVIVGPGKNAQGAVITPWQSYNPTPSAIVWTNSTYSGFWRRVGENLEIKVSRICTGTPAAAGASNFSIPAGLTIDTSKIFSSNDSLAQLGTGSILDFGLQSYTAVTKYLDSTTIRAWYISGTLGQVTNISNTAPFTFGISDSVTINATIPIAEWAGSGTLNAGENDVEYAFNTSTATAAGDSTSFGYGPQGAQIQNITAILARRVRFKTSIQPGDMLGVEISQDRITWIPQETGAIINGQNVVPFVLHNNVGYGLGRITPINSTDVDVLFAQYSQPGASYNGVGGAWSAGAGAGFWRVVKRKAGVAVGFGLATANQAGLVKAGQVPGTNTNDTALAGNVGEVISNITTTAWSASEAESAAITLTPGNWLINSTSALAGDTTNRLLSAGISTTSASFAGLTEANQLARNAYQTTSGFGYVSVNSLVVSISSTTTYYLNTRTTSISGLAGSNHKLQAIRLR